MVGALLRLPKPPRSDHAADALAVAICHAGHLRAPAVAHPSAPAEVSFG
jgi:Holliday junction resolvasome RuvABC endonuclease subunit